MKRAHDPLEDAAGTLGRGKILPPSVRIGDVKFRGLQRRTHHEQSLTDRAVNAIFSKSSSKMSLGGYANLDVCR